MAWSLGIDTSSIHLDIGLSKDGNPAASFCRFLPGSHAEHISQAVSFMLQANKVNPAEIDLAGISVGPGSFTGLRIGIAFIKGFFLARKCGILALSSLETTALALNDTEGLISVVYEARQGRVFYARFLKEKNILTRITEDTLSSVETAEKECRADKTVLIDMLGFKSSVLPSVFSGHAGMRISEKTFLMKGLALAGRVWTENNCGCELKNPVDIVPHYLMQSAAQEKCAAAHGKSIQEG
jgi:tRNA threonylcarbamoyladenosine biosynthesis protein TsaB